MANTISFKNEAFPDGEEFALFGMFLVKNGESYTLTEEDELRFEQNFGVKYADYGKPDPDDDTVGANAEPTADKPKTENKVIGGIGGTTSSLGGEK